MAVYVWKTKELSLILVANPFLHFKVWRIDSQTLEHERTILCTVDDTSLNTQAKLHAMELSSVTSVPNRRKLGMR